jgi:polyphosphate kinase
VRDQLLETYLRDNTCARVLQPDGNYTRLTPEAGELEVDSQSLDMGYHAHAINMTEQYGR